MDFQPVIRPTGSYQEPVSAVEVTAMCRRILGSDIEVRSAIELRWGSYNTTFTIELAGAPRVVLRIAPRPGAQLPSERHWLRSEYSAAPWLVVLGDLVPQVIGADFTQQVVGRDFMVQTELGGVPVPELMSSYPKALWPVFFGQLGAITRTVHQATGETWGPVAAPAFHSWSDAIYASLIERAADLGSLSAPTEDVARLAAIVDRCRAGLDTVARPALLHGDLWTANILLDPLAAEPTVVGVLDSERAWWGDPLADWALFRADERAVPPNVRLSGPPTEAGRQRRNKSGESRYTGAGIWRLSVSRRLATATATHFQGRHGTSRRCSLTSPRSAPSTRSARVGAAPSHVVTPNGGQRRRGRRTDSPRHAATDH